MATWAAFAEGDPELASTGEQLFQQYGVVLIGTLKRDGWPRVTPVEPVLFEGELLFGMPRESMKARDLVRDPRCTAHSAVAAPDGEEGEFIVYGRAVDRSGDAAFMLALEAHFASIGWSPFVPYYQFTVDIERAWHVRHGQGRRWPAD